MVEDPGSKTPPLPTLGLHTFSIQKYAQKTVEDFLSVAVQLFTPVRPKFTSPNC